MVYLIVRVKFQPGRETEFIEMLENEYIPILRDRYGWELVSSWKVLVGDLHEIMNTWRFASLGEFWNSREAMFGDREYMEARQRLHALMADEHISFATPLGRSPM